MEWLKVRLSSAKTRLVARRKVTLAFVGLVLVLFLLAWILWKVPERQVRYLRQTDISRLDTKDRIQFEKDVIAAENSARVTLAQILGGFALLVGLYFTYKNIRVTEEGKLTERFSKAVELLGNEKLDVRLGGIYALERMARDSQKDHWTVMEVLTAFVREQSKEEYLKSQHSDRQPSYYDAVVPELRELYQLANRLREDIQAALTVIGRRKWTEQEKPHQRIDLSGSFLKGVDLNGAVLRNAIFRGAKLPGSFLVDADLKRANFTTADLSGADLNLANLRETYLTYANLSGASLHGVNLRKSFLIGANFSTSTGLTWEQLSKATINELTKLPPDLEERRKAEQVNKAAAPNQ